MGQGKPRYDPNKKLTLGDFSGIDVGSSELNFAPYSAPQKGVSKINMELS